MPLSPAPFHADLCPSGADAQAYWATTQDGKRVRLGLWGKDAGKGTILLFPGRTEYVEKYAPAAADFEMRGYCTLAIDWRGQGLADRLVDDPMVGHVDRFSDYQLDVAAMLGAAKELDLPKPYYLVGHSMGGAIGLRALIDGLPVNAAMFSAPMWGIHMAPYLRPAAWVLSHLMPMIGQGARNVTGTTLDSYVLSAPFEDNTLTTDRAMFEMMQNQTKGCGGFGLGGASYTWLREALHELRALAAAPAPDLPCLTFLGTNERIVQSGPIQHKMAAWPKGSLIEVQGAEHEILMEVPKIRDDAFDQTAALFDQHA